MNSNSAQSLSHLEPQHSFFVGIDSDGCAFDSMEIKQKECFCPNTIKYWKLQPVSKYAREAVEFVNLYSKWRGTNRWPALLKVFDLLRDRVEVVARDAAIPEALELRAFVASGAPLSNDGLKGYQVEHPAAELDLALEWSLAVNKSIAELVYGLPPFPMVRESLELLASQADIVVVSQTPTEALVREWKEHDLDRYARAIAGQELGTKTQHLQMATRGHYAPHHLLMIGDALGDWEAAQVSEALFFPINPGHEEESWRRFFEEGIQRLLQDEFAGAYETERLSEFVALLPETPPWQRTDQKLI